MGEENGSTVQSAANDQAVNNGTPKAGVTPAAPSANVDGNSDGDTTNLEGQSASGTILDGNGTNDDATNGNSNDGNDGSDGAPESYEPFETSEGLVMDDKSLEGFTEIAKSLNLSQEQAQKLVSFQSEMVKQQQDSILAENDKLTNEWLKETNQIFGAKKDEHVASMKKVLDARPELKQYLIDTKLVNHPQIAKVLSDFGKLISEDDGGSSSTPAGGVKLPREQILFGGKK